MASTYNISVGDRQTMPLDLVAFTAFLVEAKKGAGPSSQQETLQSILPGATQIEYTRGLYTYKNVYQGSERFAGQETIYHDNRPMWSMSYAGGLINHYMWDLQPQWIYAVLRAALAQVSEEMPFRGPLKYEYHGFEYSNHPLGHMAEFLGEETIKYRGAMVYHLWYIGGFVK